MSPSDGVAYAQEAPSSIRCVEEGVRLADGSEQVRPATEQAAREPQSAAPKQAAEDAERTGLE